MNLTFRMSLISIFLINLGLPHANISQDLNVKIGTIITIKSEILNEDRNIIIHLPDNYGKSGKSYPVLYQLDGNTETMLETVTTVNRLLKTEEVIPELIIVAIENTNRARDMWPVNTKYYPEPNIAGAKNFLNFIEKELIPYVENKYRTNESRIFYGQSLSAVFTIFAFLNNPNLFSSYIASSGAFPACEDHFKDLSAKAFNRKEQFKNQKLFITNGLKDQLDPDGKMNQTMIDFSNTIKENLGNRITYKYQTYENEGHVPFYSLHDGLKFIFIQE